MPAIITIWFKEILDTLRDRRTLYAMIIAPLLVMPLFAILPQKLFASRMKQQEEATIKLAVVRAEEASDLVAYLKDTGQVEIVEPPADLVQALQEGEITAALVVPPGFAQDMAAERPTQLKVLSDESRMPSSVAANRLRLLLQEYAQRVVSERLVARGLDPQLVKPFRLERENVASEQRMGATFLGMMLPAFIALWAVVGGMYTAIDVTAGEKERGTLEPLLVVPINRLQIVLGKLLAVITTSTVAVFLSLVSMYAAMQFYPAETFTGEEEVVFSLPPGTLALLILTALPLIVMLNSLEIAACIFARSFKEAQNYIVPLQFAVMLPALPLAMIPDLSLPAAARLVPVVGSILAFRDLLMGTAELHALLLAVGSSLLYALVALLIAVNVFSREKAILRV